MPSYRTEDCEAWAKRKAQQLAKHGSPKLLELKPKPPARVLGGIKMPPTGQMVWPQPPWHYHFAALLNGIAYDEAYPNGLPLAQYRARFEHHDMIDFKERPV